MKAATYITNKPNLEFAEWKGYQAHVDALNKIKNVKPKKHIQQQIDSLNKISQRSMTLHRQFQISKENQSLVNRLSSVQARPVSLYNSNKSIHKFKSANDILKKRHYQNIAEHNEKIANQLTYCKPSIIADQFTKEYQQNQQYSHIQRKFTHLMNGQVASQRELEFHLQKLNNIKESKPSIPINSNLHKAGASQKFMNQRQDEINRENKSLVMRLNEISARNAEANLIKSTNIPNIPQQQGDYSKKKKFYDIAKENEQIAQKLMSCKSEVVSAQKFEACSQQQKQYSKNTKRFHKTLRDKKTEQQLQVLKNSKLQDSKLNSELIKNNSQKEIQNKETIDKENTKDKKNEESVIESNEQQQSKQQPPEENQQNQQN